MKKGLMIVMIAVLLALPAGGMVFAEKKSPIIKGEVTAMDEGAGTVTLLTDNGETIILIAPQGFNFKEIAIGSEVQAKTSQSENGDVTAEWIRAKEQGTDDSDEEDPNNDKEEKEKKENAEGKSTSSYCSGMKETPHPFAAAIAETYDVPIDSVMAYFCEGYGFGEIMLAYQTNQINGEDANAMLEYRKSGQGWGQIWQEMDLIGNADKAKTPPGQLKKNNP